MSDPFDRFDRGFDKAFERPGRTVAGIGCLAILLNVLWVLFIAAVIIGGIVILKNLGVF